MIDVAAVARRDRRRATLEMLGDPFDWAAETVALVVVALVVLEVLPGWTLIMAAVLIVRPAIRLLLRGLSAALNAP